MKSELKTKAVSGFLWNGIGNITVQLMQFIFTIILARILSPEDYGLTAILFVFYFLCMLLIDSGFSTALVRKKTLTKEDVSTAFFFNLVIAVFCYIILFFIAPFIASYYERPLLCSLLRVFGIIVIVVSFMLIPNCILTRDVNFKKISEINIFSNLCGNIIAVVLALKGFGVWSLVCSYLSTTIIAAIMYWIMAKWKPICLISRESFKYLLNFSYKFLLDGAISTVVNNVNNVVIGKMFSTRALGFYAKANGIVQIPSTAINNIILQVSCPVLAKMQDDKERLRFNYRRMIRMAAFISFPLMIGLSAVAEPLMTLVYTDKWNQSILYMQILCFSTMWLPILSLNKDILVVLNRPDLILRLRIINTVIFVLIFLLSVRYGILGLCVGAVVNNIVNLATNSFYMGKFVHLGFLLQVKDMSFALFNALFMGGLVLLSTKFTHSLWINTFLPIAIGATSYLLTSLLSKREELYEIKEMIKDKFSKKNKNV